MRKSSLYSLALVVSALSAGQDLGMFSARAGGCSSQCTGVGNDTHPVGHFKPKKKPFGARRQSKKERSRSR
jgi:hypothetical protein